MLKNKKSGFTLAEVLVTLMIIGVIAALTIPSLKKHAEMNEYVAAVKRANSVVAQATRMVENEHGDYKRWRFKDGTDAEIKRIFEWYKPYLSLSRECASSTTGCWSATTDLLGAAVGAGNKGIGGNTQTFTTADGMNFCFDGIGAGYGVNVPAGNLGIWVDVNGDRQPNKLGMDVFLFLISDDRGVIPSGADDPAMCKRDKTGQGCTAYVIQNGKIDY